MKYVEIYNFWADHPCNGGYKDFPFWYFKGKKVLEIGCGTGNDAQRFAEAGALYTGIDLTHKAVELTKLKVGNRGKVLVMNSEQLDFPDETFDLVYSFGVVHHTVSPLNVIDEVYRVLKTDGYIFLMLYNKFSYRYLIEIMLLRKILWHLNYYKFREIKKQIPSPTKEQWVSINTDDIGCPMSRVYTKKQAKELLDKFKITNTWTENLGWFRMIIGQKPPTDEKTY